MTVRVQKVKDELQLWLEDDDDLGDLCLSRKIATTSSPVSDSDEQINSYPTSPTIGAKISRAKSHLVRSATVRGDDQNDVEEVEMLLEAHYMQIDRTLNKLAELREYLDDTEDYINFQVMETYTLYLPEFYTCNEKMFSFSYILYVNYNHRYLAASQ